MGKLGRLTKDRFGYSMPVDAPAYVSPPFDYKDVEVIRIVFETDEDAALDVLPEGLELPTPATATVSIIHYPFSTLGAYDEVILSINCTFQGEPRSYSPYMMVNADAPMVAGREIWGIPKKMAYISFHKDGENIIGTMERPAGNRIVTGVIRPERSVSMPTARGRGVFLRVFPSPEEGAPPSVAELVELHSSSSDVQTWQGTGSLTFGANSLIDPWHKLEMKRLIAAYYSRQNIVIGYGKVIKRY